MKYYITLLIALLALVVSPSSVLASKISVAYAAENANFPLVQKGIASSLIVDPLDAEVVTIAATAFSGDIKLITDIEPVVSNAIIGEYPIIIGTLGASILIDSLVQTGKISTEKIAGEWETFCISVINHPFDSIDQALVIYGSDPRGTAFGVFQLSRILGVSPMVWWADVIPEKHNELYVTTGENIVGPPSVQYRGIFINDEDWGLQPWAAKNDPTKDIGPRTYEKVFEMLLRVKANYIWPAMHPSTHSFNYFTENKVVAGRYAIIMGSSHHEPLLYNTIKDWPYSSNQWNPYTNLSTIMEELEKRVISNGKYENIYTLCMRGAGDSAMPGTLDQQTEKLQECLALERGLLEKHVNTDITKVPQVLFPYKEVLNQYNNGLDVPEDVTLGWVDDNFSYIRQLSTPQEQERNGGGGVYFHFSYWGKPYDYLWLSSVSPSLTSSEMSKAYALNAKKIWVFNVGDIKPIEMMIQFSMDMAWDVDAWTPEKAHLYSTQWASETFGEEFGESIGAIKEEYFHLAASGKPEHISSITYSEREMNERIASYEDLVSAAKTVQSQIPERLQDAYFELIEYPVEAAANMNIKVLRARQSLTYAAQGNEKALEYAAQATTAYENIISLTNKYNTEIAGGKWNGIMNYAPRSLNRFYDPTVATEINTNALPAADADSVFIMPAANYASKNEAGHTISTIEGLGNEKSALSVWPLDMTTYTSSNVSSAPYVDYNIPVLKGTNIIAVRCLPTFPLYTSLGLRYAISIAGATPEFHNIENAALSSAWATNLLRGYVSGDSKYQSNTDTTIKARVYFTDPSLVISALAVTSNNVNALTKKIINPSFEYSSAGVLNDGTTVRGYPYGWSHTGTLSGDSYGINNDGSNFSGSNLCWINATPMPKTFELYQTIDSLPAGEYIVRCRLAAFSGLLTNVRLFGNNYTQYFGNQSDYISNLTEDEINTFAGHTASASALLQEMAVKVSVFKGDSLKIGIRSSNITSNGASSTSNAGWFKVDNFRIELLNSFSGVEKEKSELDSLITLAEELYIDTETGNDVGQYPSENRIAFDLAIQSSKKISVNDDALLESIIIEVANLEAAINTYKNALIKLSDMLYNPDFEYKSEGVLNDGSVVRGIPYGWSSNGTLLGNSFGLSKDGITYHGSNLCWINSSPMPNTYELYQTIKNFPAGKYLVQCRLAVMSDRVTNQRLFANNNVQYYGNKSDYTSNLTDGEINTFAGWTPTASYNLKELSVEIEITEGEDLKFGIRSGNQLSNGSRETSNNSGWFKVDYFRIEKLATTSVNFVKEKDPSIIITNTKDGFQINIPRVPNKGKIWLYSLEGRAILNEDITSSSTFVQVLNPGLYIVKVNCDGQCVTQKLKF